MTAPEFVHTEMFQLLVLPLLIFVARICDVTIGTMRIIFVNRGLKYIAPIAGFFEVLIWLVAIGQVMSNLTSVQNYIAYALGFATGNFVGIQLENRIALGHVSMRIITRVDATELVAHLRGRGYGVTDVDAQGDSGPVKLVFLIVSRHDLPQVVETIKRFNPKAYYTVEDVRFVSQAAAALAPQPLPGRHGDRPETVTAGAMPTTYVGGLPAEGERRASNV